MWGVPGAGKTTLTDHFLQMTEQSVLGDELCFYQDQQIEGVPLHLHIKKKRTEGGARSVPIPSHRFQAQARLRVLYCLSSKRADVGRISNLSIVQKLQLAFRVWIGEGLHQMAEFHLRWDQIFILCKLAGIRLVKVFQLFQRTEVKALVVPHFDKQTKAQTRNWIEALVQLSFRS